jgi:hypothetical protein
VAQVRDPGQVVAAVALSFFPGAAAARRNGPGAATGESGGFAEERTIPEGVLRQLEKGTGGYEAEAGSAKSESERRVAEAEAELSAGQALRVGERVAHLGIATEGVHAAVIHQIIITVDNCRP